MTAEMLRQVTVLQIERKTALVLLDAMAAPMLEFMNKVIDGAVPDYDSLQKIKNEKEAFYSFSYAVGLGRHGSVMALKYDEMQKAINSKMNARIAELD